MSRNCDTCGRPYEAQTRRSRYCGELCRKRKQRGAARAPSVDSVDDPLVAATRRELDAAGAASTAMGQLALVLAAAMATAQTPAGLAGLSKELSRVVATATGTTQMMTPAAGAGDAVDELKARRDTKRKAQP